MKIKELLCCQLCTVHSTRVVTPVVKVHTCLLLYPRIILRSRRLDPYFTLALFPVVEGYVLVAHVH